MLSWLSNSINHLFPKKCPICHQVTPQRYLCENCNLSFVVLNKNEDYYYLYEYRGVARSLIHLIKFRQRKDLAQYYQEILKNYADLFNKYDYIIPVPSFILRKILRRYEPLKLFFAWHQKYNDKFLKRIKQTRHFYSLNKEARFKEISNSFMVKFPESLKDKNVLVLDDIHTTGATYNEVKKTLLLAGCKKVEGFFLTKAKYDQDK